MATIHKLTKDGATIFPATITDAVVHPQTGKTLTSMIKEYNVSELFPAEGIDGGNKYNLSLAIQVLNTHLTSTQKTGGIKLTFISSLSPYPEEEYFLGKSSWSTNTSDWGQRFEVGDVVADPSGSWEPSTAQQYIDQQVAVLNTNINNESISRQTGDQNLQNQVNNKLDKTLGVTSVNYDTTNKKITKTINGVTSDVVTALKIVTDGGGGIDISGKVDKTTTVNGHALSSNVTVTKSDVGLGNVVNTGDSATPVSGGTTKFTTGGAYTELAKKADKTEVYTKTEGQTLETSVNSAITTQQTKIDALDSHEIILGALPSTGVAGKVYRVPDDPAAGQYTDYGYNAGALTTPIKIATYQMPGIDNVPMEGSENLVKSGGVYNYVVDTILKGGLIIYDDIFQKNRSLIQLNKYAASNTGTITPLNNAAVIDIPVDGAKFIWIISELGSIHNVNNYGCLIDANQAYISGITLQSYGGLVKITDDTSAIRLNIDPTKIDGIHVYGITKGIFYSDVNFTPSYSYGYISNGQASNPNNMPIICTVPIPVKKGYSITLNKAFYGSGGESVSFHATLFGNNYSFLSTTKTSINGNGDSSFEIVSDDVKYISMIGLSVNKESIHMSVNISSGDTSDKSKWDGKIWVGLGDSLTLQQASANWSNAIENKCGLVFKNCGLGSTSLAGNYTDAFWKRLDTVENYNPDIVTILGGANDLYFDVPIGSENEFGKSLSQKDCTTFIGAYSYIIETLLTWKKSLRIVLMTNSYAHNDGNDHTPGIGLTYGDYAEACRKVGYYYGLPVVDLYYQMGINKLTQDNIYTTDGIHWNARGAQIVSSLVISKLKEINNC